MPLGHHHDLEGIIPLVKSSTSVLATPPILVNPTANEAALLALISHPCFDARKDCAIPPLLDNPTPCEEAFIKLLLKGGCKTQLCNLIPMFPDPCTPNLKKIIQVVTPPQPGGAGGPPGAPPCGPTGLPLSISTLDPNQLGEADGEVTCNTVLPEIRLTAAGGVAPYTWSIDNPVDSCTYRGVGGIGAPKADSTCDKRFVITAPTNGGGAGVPAYEVRVGTVVCSGPPKPATCVAEGGTCSGGSKCCIEQGNGTFITRDCDGNNVLASCSSGLPVGPFIYVGTNSTDNQACAAALGISVPDALGICESLRNDDATGFDTIDIRTQGQKDANCCPCEMAMNGLVVTVTDAESTSVSITLVVNG